MHRALIHLRTYPDWGSPQPPRSPSLVGAHPISGPPRLPRHGVTYQKQTLHRSTLFVSRFTPATLHLLSFFTQLRFHPSNQWLGLNASFLYSRDPTAQRHSASWAQTPEPREPVRRRPHRLRFGSEMPWEGLQGEVACWKLTASISRQLGKARSDFRRTAHYKTFHVKKF